MTEFDSWRYPEGTTAIGSFQIDEGEVDVVHIPMRDGVDSFVLTYRRDTAVISGQAITFQPGQPRVIELGTFDGRPCFYTHGEKSCLN